MSKFAMEEITEEQDRGAQTFVFYAAAKWGKTTLICSIPGLFILCPEDGLKGIDKPAPHFPRAPRNLVELYEALEAFERGNKPDGKRRFNHLAIDSLSWVETQLAQSARAEIRNKNLGDNYQSGWGVVSGLWDTFFERITLLRRRAGVHVWLVAHAEQAAEVAIDGSTWKKWDLQLERKAAALVRKSVDHIFFGAHKASVVKGGKGKRAIGQYGGRVIYTRDSADHFAGSRSSVPEVVTATWPDLQAALSSGAPAAPEKLQASIFALLSRLSPTDRATIEADVEAAKDPRALSRTLSRAQGMAALLEEDEDDQSAGETSPEDSGADEAEAPVDDPIPGEEDEALPEPIAATSTPARPAQSSTPANDDVAAEARRVVALAGDRKAIALAFTAISRMPIDVALRQELAAELRSKQQEAAA